MSASNTDANSYALPSTHGQICPKSMRKICSKAMRKICPMSMRKMFSKSMHKIYRESMRKSCPKSMGKSCPKFMRKICPKAILKTCHKSYDLFMLLQFFANALTPQNASRNDENYIKWSRSCAKCNVPRPKSILWVWFARNFPRGSC